MKVAFESRVFGLEERITCTCVCIHTYMRPHTYPFPTYHLKEPFLERFSLDSTIVKLNREKNI